MRTEPRIGYHKRLYILPFDHRSSFEKGLYGWSGVLSAEQTERIAQTKEIIFDGFKFALGTGLAKDQAGILVDEQFGARILRDASANSFITAMPAERAARPNFNSSSVRNMARISNNSSRPSSRSWCATMPRMTTR